jgi:hypothetical protein
MVDIKWNRPSKRKYLWFCCAQVEYMQCRVWELCFHIFRGNVQLYIMLILYPYLLLLYKNIQLQAGSLVNSSWKQWCDLRSCWSLAQKGGGQLSDSLIACVDLGTASPTVTFTVLMVTFWAYVLSRHSHQAAARLRSEFFRVCIWGPAMLLGFHIACYGIGIETGYSLNDQGAGVQIPVGSRIFSTSSGPSLGPTQAPIQWVPEVNWWGRKVDHSHPTSAEVKNMRIYISIPPDAFMAQCLIR